MRYSSNNKAGSSKFTKQQLCVWPPSEVVGKMQTKNLYGIQLDKEFASIC
jgi:hypothetical protein